MMEYLLHLTFTQMGFWLTWILIPVIVEIIPAVASALSLMLKNWHAKKVEEPDRLPFISIIIPVYNSADTLFECIGSIHQSNYPKELIQVVLADNQSKDNSFEVFNEAHNFYNDLNMQWIRTEQGKARALNSAIYECIGTYIVNIDSDGVLEKDALRNIVLKFEKDSKIAAMTGTILTKKEMIAKPRQIFRYFLQKNEYFEYAQAFLSGRTTESVKNRLFTMAGAFSAFRKEVLLSTHMYNPATVGEDTDMTFQIRERLKGKVVLCEDAIFFVDPIENWDNLYIQRQRWQRGELEVVKSYLGEQAGIRRFFESFLIRRIIIDHTFVFPKMIWLFASIVLLFFGYSAQILGLSYLLIYFLYVLVSLFNFITVQRLLISFKEERAFYLKSWFCIFTMPVYTFILSWIRLIGIINSMVMPAKWSSKHLSEELRTVKETVTADIRKLKRGDKHEQ